MQTNWALELSRAHVPVAGQANLFGVVLYTARHAHVCKMLADEYYWNGLDDASGPYWVVFAIRAAPGELTVPAAKPGSLSLMKAIWREPSANKDLLSAFDLRSTEKLPALVVFAETEEGNIYRTLVELDDKNEQAAYASLNSALDEVNQCVTGMKEEYRQVKDRAFPIVDQHFWNQRQWQNIKRAFSFYSWLKSQV